MALKRNLTTAEYSKLSDDLKKEYKVSGDGYALDVDLGDDDPAELRRARDREKQTAKDLRKERDELKAKLDDEADAGSRKAGDIEKLETSWKNKLAAQATELNALIAKKDGFLTELLVDNVAQGLAHKISNAPGLILPHIKSRLTADLSGDKPITKVLKDGQASALTVDDLQKEFVANKDFSAIIIGSKATGSGASQVPGKPSSGTPAFGSNSDKPASLASMAAGDLAGALKDKVAAAKEAAT